MMQEAKYRNIPGNLPWRGGCFMSLEAAKNWVQAAIVVKIGMAPAPYGSFWMCFLAACVFTGVPPGGHSGCPGCPLPGHWQLPGTIQTNTHVYIYIYICMWAQETQYGFPGPKLKRPCWAFPASEISKFQWQCHMHPWP